MNRVFCCHPVFSFLGDLTFSRMEKKTDLRKNKLSDVWREEQKIYSHYADCKLCNLGCVVESAWSTYDLKFIIQDSFFGTILPTMKRVGERNGGREKSKILYVAASPKMEQGAKK